VIFNALCGVVSDAIAFGFVLGAHTVIPTIGADIFAVWAGNGEVIYYFGVRRMVICFHSRSATVGAIALGFVGFMIFAIPLVGVIFPILIMAGMAILYAGAGG
jgi:hypothetical protein